ncbi:MAG: response regulator transcription factor [Magnetococcales bacterium]|nr:response regulator transcription factor [Magnetococcales bacterium]
MFNIIIVESDAQLRESLMHCLTLSGFRAEGVSSGLDLFKRMAVQPFDAAVINIGLPDQDGWSIIEYLRQNSQTALAVLTANNRLEERIRYYEAGADLVFHLPVECRELSAALTNLCKRLSSHSNKTDPLSLPKQETTTAYTHWQLDHTQWDLIAPNGKAVHLTPKEMQLLSSLAQKPGEPVHRDALMNALGYNGQKGSNRNLDTIVRRLRRKVEEGLGVQVPVQTVHTIGYLFSAPIEV